jgi:hypothetical protein
MKWKRNTYAILFENPKEGDHLEEFDIDGK